MPQNAPPSHSPQKQPLKVQYIANEGVLLQWQNRKVLIDAIHQPYSPYYLSTPDSLLSKMMAGKAPFDQIDILIISHVHGDHFHAATVAEYLARQPKVQIVGAPQMKDSLQKHSANFSAIAAQIHTPVYQAGEQQELEINGIQLELFGLAHGHERNKWVENLATIVHLGAHRILHLGDPNLRSEPFVPFHFPEKNISLGLLPDWFLTSQEGKTLVDQYIAPQNIIGVHVSPQWEKDSREAMKIYFPGVDLFTEPMEFQVFD